MRIVALSDTHNQHRKVQVPPGDVVIHAGDFCINGTEDEALDFVQWFRELPHRHKSSSAATTTARSLICSGTERWSRRC